MELSDLNLNFNYGFDLRERPESSKDIFIAIELLSRNLRSIKDPKEKIKTLGQLGGYCRSMGKLDLARGYFNQASEIIQNHNLGKKLEIINRIRKAHVLQWKEEFEVSTHQFDSIVEECKKNSRLTNYLDFAYQHRGKNYFDQKLFELAIKDFYSALLIRNKKSETSLVESTLFAMEVTKEKLYKKVSSEQINKILLDSPSHFIQCFYNKNHEKDQKRSNCINAVLNCFANNGIYTFQPYKPMELILQLKKEFIQISNEQMLKCGDLIIAWNREKNSIWSDKKISVEQIEPSDKDFPYGIIFDHVAYYIKDNIVFNKPNPSPNSKYRFEYIDSAMTPAKFGYGFEVTFHRKKYD